MLSETVINELAVKWQTTRANVAREYLQHVFLASLYRLENSDELAFKGGTALRLLFRSPRFSEDLDFSAETKPFHLKGLLAQVVLRLKEEGIILETAESKATSGGFLALFEGRLYGENTALEVNVSSRKKVRPEPILATTPLYPSYQCLVLSTPDLVAEKCEALLSRRKPRDYFDLYFCLRERLGIAVIIPLKRRLTDSVRSLDVKAASRELKVFLPVSHHPIVANLGKNLLSELNRL
ncbi:MAG: nucleotidyl transferase AbiEii/AbiGii toxin family protein [Deltaproteobacteria bacterium]|nr:nucleotidyl transferase AbiEii/AbiGii toxin family protein [Deltaproteobacteria bacterium]